MIVYSTCEAKPIATVYMYMHAQLLRDFCILYTIHVPPHGQQIWYHMISIFEPAELMVN